MSAKVPAINETIHQVGQTTGATTLLTTPSVDTDILVNISLFNSSAAGGVTASVQWTPPGQSQLSVLVTSVNFVVGQSPGSVIFIRAAAGTAVNVITSINNPTTYDLNVVALDC